jgi:hypothetical protein
MKKGADLLREVEKLGENMRKLDENLPAAYQTVKSIFVDTNII